MRANVVDAEIPKEMSQFAEPKTLTENVGSNDRSVSNGPSGQPSGERRTNEGREMPDDVKRRRVCEGEEPEEEVTELISQEQLKLIAHLESRMRDMESAR